MEFIGKNTYSELIFNLEEKYIFYNDIKYNFDKINSINTTKYKIEAGIYIIKYIDNLIYLYTKDNELLDEFLFTKTSVKTIADSNTAISSFRLDRNTIIKLFIHSSGNYIKVNDTSYKIIEILYSGSDTIYKTENNDTLTVGKVRNSKWNGITIGNVI